MHILHSLHNKSESWGCFVDVLAYSRLTCPQKHYRKLFNSFINRDMYILSDYRLYFYEGFVDKAGQEIELYLSDFMDSLKPVLKHPIRYFKRNDYDVIKEEILDIF